MPTVQYQLIDFGDGRKLESLGDFLIDRPSPAAQNARRRDPGCWSAADARYDADAKNWRFKQPFPNDLLVDCGGFVMPVYPTPFGHLGLFPEQQSNWRWLQSLEQPPSDPINALNLFAYTGASSMALAKAGFHVAHVDAAKPNVEAARVAAKVNGLGESPIRYLVDDAAKFAAREVRRGRCYHTIILDPPAYGHSPKGKAWRLDRDLWPLLDDCLRLLANHFAADIPGSRHGRLLITGHSPDIGIQEVEGYLRSTAIVANRRFAFESQRSSITDQTGRKLDTGYQVRATFS